MFRPPCRYPARWLIAALLLTPAVPAMALGADAPAVKAPAVESPDPGAAALLGPEPLVLSQPFHRPGGASEQPRPADPLARRDGGAPTLVPAPSPPAAPAPAPAPTAAPVPTPPPASPARRLVLDRQHRLLKVFENDRELRRYPVAVGMPGWETPVGSFEVIEMTSNPTWKHPANGKIYPPGPANPLGSRWIGFHRDCRGRSGFNGNEHLEVKGCVTSGFHGTPNRETVGRAVSHGCVRLYDEHARDLFELVRVGTPVMVLP